MDANDSTLAVACVVRFDLGEVLGKNRRGAPARMLRLIGNRTAYTSSDDRTASLPCRVRQRRALGVAPALDEKVERPLTAAAA